MRKPMTPSMRLKKEQHMKDTLYKLLMKDHYENITMDQVGKACGVAKGTLFNYFPTKESLFLGLLDEKMDGWYQRLEENLTQRGQMAAEQLSYLLVDWVKALMTEDPVTLDLLLRSHVQFEDHVSLEHAKAFRDNLYQRMNKTAATMAQNVQGFTLVKGVKLLLFFHTMLIGHLQLAKLPKAMVMNLSEEEQENYGMDLAITLGDGLRVYMTGVNRS